MLRKTRTPEQNQSSYGKTQKYFEETVIANHLDIYLFDRAVYINNGTDVELGCKKHRVYFKVKAMTMLRRTKRNGGKKKNPIVGSCPVCRIEYFDGIKDDIISKCKQAHNNEYIYGEYVNQDTLLKVYCKIHGEFKVMPYNHSIGGNRCPVCYPVYPWGRKPNPFIKHVGKQKYYICDIHGDVPIGKNRHGNQGCPTCNIIENNRQQNDDFIQRINKTYGKDYDVFITKKYVEFRCKKHMTRTTVKRKKVRGGNKAIKYYCNICRNEEIVKKQRLNVIRIEGEVKAKLKSEYDGYYEFLELIPRKNKSKEFIVRLKVLQNHSEKLVRVASIIDGGLSINHRRQPKKNYLSYDEAKKKMKVLGITGFREYQKWYKRVEQDNLPANIFRYYTDNGGWISYIDFFGREIRDNMSAGEKRIADYLDRKNVVFEYQKRYQDCKDKNCLPFDFYLPKYNTIVEFDGYQHYHKVKQFGSLEYIQRHDDIKNKYCHDNGITLLRISYWELEDNMVEWILDNELTTIAAILAV